MRGELLPATPSLSSLVVPIHPPHAPYFGLPLWLQTSTRHGILWAYNAEHLAWLTSVVEATLRERTSESGNSALLSRLPKWVKAAKGREANGRALERLRERLVEA